MKNTFAPKRPALGTILTRSTYYPRSVWNEHAGPYFRYAAAGLIFLSLLMLDLAADSPAQQIHQDPFDALDLPRLPFLSSHLPYWGHMWF